MKITVLGSGTSSGVPVTACSCPVCMSTDPQNKRTRSSILVEEGDSTFLVDSSTDLRFQLLRESIQSIDGVFYTHAHADHIHGIDDLRPYTYRKDLPLYGSSQVLEEIKSRFPYIFIETTQRGGGKPRLYSHVITHAQRFGSLEVTPLNVFHGLIPIYGYRFNDFVYLTDCSRIPEETMVLIRGCRFMIIGGLRYRSHETHFSINEAVDIIKKTGPERAWLTHICHDVDHNTLSKELPPGIEPACDGLKIEF
jgi:phosphoribosyl 1,2-cyclic phosphate phosphodiesterase